MASKLNEEIMNTSLDMGDGEIKIEGKANPVYADAINVHSKKKKEVDKALKDKKPELKKPFLGTKGTTTIMPKTSSMKKLKLSENMFKNIREHMADAPEVYEEIFRVIDNMEHIINYISNLTEEELTYEDMKQSYDVLEDAMYEFKVYLEELKSTKNTKNESTAVLNGPRDKKTALQDKRNNKDDWSNIYNELVDMKPIESPNRRMGKQNRYKSSWDDANAIRVGASRDGEGIVVKADNLSDLDFAKEVAETYGVEWRVKEHTSRYAECKYEILIYPYRKVAEVKESLKEETKSIKLSGLDKKALKYIQDYRAHKFDLEDLHTYIEKLYGNKKTAVTRLAELDELSDSDIDKILGVKESIKSKRTRK